MNNEEYKIGDEVIIRKDLKVGTWYGVDDFVQEMRKFRGKKAIITHMGINDSENPRFYLDIDNQNWTWTREMFKKE